ncbi:MAG: TrbI/VirB10 family protein, partial [Cyanobacteria bacterium P01_F01_bin.53]
QRPQHSGDEVVKIKDDTVYSLAEESGFQVVSSADPGAVDEFANSLTDEPETGLSPHDLPLHKNPWLRVGAACAFIGLSLGIGAIFMLGKKSKVEVAQVPEEAETLTLSLNKSIASSPAGTGEASEVDQLKAEMALLEQQIAMAQLARGEDVDLPRDPDTRRATSREESSANQKPTKPSSARSTPAARPVAQVSQRLPTSARSAPRTLSQPAFTRTRVPVPSSPAPAYNLPDPQAQWLAASNAGILGVSPMLEPVEPPVNLSEVATAFEPPADYRLKGQPTSTPIKSEPVQLTQSIPGLFDAGPSLIPMGQGARAVVTTPITWLNEGDQFFVQVTEPIYAQNEQVAIPEGAYVIVQPVSVDPSSRLGELAVVGLVIGDETIPIDYALISIKGAGGDPLVADTYGDIGSDIAANDAEMMLIGALGRVGEELIRPDSESITNTAFGSSVSTTNGDTNILGAILAGGAEQLVARMGDRNQERLDDIRARSPIFYIPEGREVEVYINENFEL